MFDPNGMRPFVANWPDTARSLLDRVRREAVGGVVDAKTSELIKALLAYADIPNGGKPVGVTNLLPVMPLSFLRNGQVLNYFSMVTTVGSPQMIAAQELRMECMFPADEATECNHRSLMDEEIGPASISSASVFGQ